MKGTSAAQRRRRVGIGVLTFGVGWLAWTFFPGLPVMRAPQARAEVRQAGLELFVHEWQPHDRLAHGDGLGPVFNARSCVACHFQGGVGGGGGARDNVLAYEALPTRSHSDVQTGLVHRFAVEERFSERALVLQTLFPTVPNGVEIRGVCFSERHDFNPVHTQSLNSIALFGAGWIDGISVKAITHQRLRRSVAEIGKELGGNFQGIPPGRARVLPDGRIGKFGWKAQFATLEEFVAAACANELGLGTPRLDQARPLGSLRSAPACAPAPRPAAAGPDLDQTQFRALVAFVATLPRPQEILPVDARERLRVERGRAVFEAVGCAACHTPDLGGVTGVYSDFLLHRIVDNRKSYSEHPDVPPPPEHPLPEEWKTAPLWGVADSAPYFHDGATPTLAEAILRHEGDARASIEAYQKLAADDRAALLRFLESLKAPADAPPPTPPPGEAARGQLALAR
jgi:mono/diheme cytochrome c family protein